MMSLCPWALLVTGLASLLQSCAETVKRRHVLLMDGCTDGRLYKNCRRVSDTTQMRQRVTLHSMQVCKAYTRGRDEAVDPICVTRVADVLQPG